MRRQLTIRTDTLDWYNQGLAMLFGVMKGRGCEGEAIRHAFEEWRGQGSILEVPSEVLSPNEAEIAAATKDMVERGMSVFEMFMLADGDDDHCYKLLDFYNPVHRAVVVDMGAGIGSVAAMMHDYRPDLTFILVNNNRFQLSLMSYGVPWYADMDHTGLQDGIADLVIFNYSLGYGPILDHTLREAYRLLAPGGVLGLWDIVGESMRVNRDLHYHVRQWSEITYSAMTNGFILDNVHMPTNPSTKQFEKFCPDYFQAIQHEMRGAISPILARFIKPTTTKGGSDAGETTGT